MESGQMAEALAQLLHRKAMREANLFPQRPDEAELSRLDSSMKRNTALTRKLRSLTEESRAGVVADIERVNQARYVGEAAAALLAAPQRPRDVPAAAEVAGTLHRRYAEFAPALLASLAQELEAPPPLDDDRAGTLRRRALGRLLLELTIAGVNRSPAPLTAELRALVAATRPGTGADDGATAAATLPLLASFVKYGRDEFFIVGKGDGDADRVPELRAGDAAGLNAEATAAAARSDDGTTSAATGSTEASIEFQYQTAYVQRWRAPRELRESFSATAREALTSGLAELRAVRGALRRARARDARALLQRGDLTDAAVARTEGKSAAHDALVKAVTSLAEALGEAPPPALGLEDDDEENDDAAVAGGGAPGEPDSDVKPATAAAINPYDDEETREFYENLLDLRALVPAVLLGGPAARSSAGQEVDDDGGDDTEEGPEAIEGAAATDGTSDIGDDVMDIDDAGMTAVSDTPAASTAGEATTPEERSANMNDPTASQSRASSALQAVLDQLGTCLSKEDADAAALAFCATAPRPPARRRLVSAMLDVPWGALAALPPRARLAATLGSVWPDIPQALESALVATARGQAAHRTAAGARGLDARIRTMRYVGELVKARAFKAGTAFRLLRALLDDFSGSNVDAACALLDCAGRFLWRWGPTVARMEAMLGVMLRLRGARRLDARQAALVDSVAAQIRAEVAAGGGSTAALSKKSRPPEHEYVRWCVYEVLPSQGPSAALRRLRRLDWRDHGSYVRATLLRAAVKGSAETLPALASLVAALRRWHPELAIGLVDCVLEEISAGLEDPVALSRQRRLAGIRLLGELYAFKVVASPVIFQTLELLCALPPGAVGVGGPSGGGGGTAAHVQAADSARLASDPATTTGMGAPPNPFKSSTPSPHDPPSDCFRLRLAVALLDVCGGFFTKGVTRQRLVAALTRLEAYAAHKDPPLPVHVEAEVAEVFARSGVPRRNFADAAAARDAVAELDGAGMGTARGQGAGPGSANDEEEEEGAASDDEDAGGASDNDEDDGHEGPLAATGDSGGSSTSSSSSDSDAESTGSSSDMDEDDDDDDDNIVLPVPHVVPEEVDEEFERELAALMLEGRHPEAGGGGLPPTVTVAVSSGSTTPITTAPTPPEPRVRLGFNVMLKRGARDARTLRTLSIPVAPAVADGILAREAAEASERAELKRLVLAAERRDAQDAEAAELHWHARPKGGRPRVSFGAPDIAG